MEHATAVASVFEEFENKPVRRKDLLPKWIRYFCWVVILGSIIMILVMFAMLNEESNAPLSYDSNRRLLYVKVVFICTYVIFTIKIVTAIGLLREKRWALPLALVDAGIYFIVCLLSLAGNITSHSNSSPDYPVFAAVIIQIAILIPYFIKLVQIRTAWQNGRSKHDA